MLLEVISHCLGYHECLALQLRAFGMNPPRRHRCLLTVVHDGAEPTGDVLTRFAPPNSDALAVRTIVLPAPEVACRAYARQALALRTEAEWVWFADVDYLPGRGFLDAVCARLAELPAPATLAIPRWIQRPTLGQSRQLILDALSAPDLPNGTNTIPERCCQVTGGAMFVRGAWCRANGFLPGVQPAPDAHWQPPAEDLLAQRRMIGSGRPSVIFAPRLVRLHNPGR